ncbi:MAG: PBSX family phage terminase large subunit [Alphaproteobacteria bacterium]|nr:PBSX family phage terminase large subunit [Alphaproteobacteria bacterium]
MVKKLKLKIWDRAFTKLFPRIWVNKSRFIVLKGSGGSSKSESACQKILLRMLLEKGHRFVFFRKVGKTIRNSQYQLFKDQVRRYSLGPLFNFRDTDMKITCKVNGNEIVAIGLDDREKIKSLTEPTGFWIEEATELDEKDFNQIILRLRGYARWYKQIIISFNPIDEYHWIRERFFPEHVEHKIKKTGFADFPVMVKLEDKVVKVNAFISHTTYKDNPFLSDEDRASYEMMKDIDPQYYQIYALGNWGKIGNLVYTGGYEMIEKSQYPEEYDDIIYGLDFGYNNPTSLSRYYLKKVDAEGIEGIRLHSYIEELVYERKLTTRDLIEIMRGLGIKKHEPIYADPSAPEKIEALQQALDEDGNYMFNVIPADNNVSVGIDYLKTIKRYSNSENINHNREIKTYKFKEDAMGRPVPEEVVKLHDHTMDNERYALYTESKKVEVKMAFV